MKWVLLTYAVASLVTFVMYALDKGSASRGGRRVPERSLHLLELAGGWPGALVAAATFRHKTRKTAYRLVRGGIMILHLVAWGWWIARR